ncbi:hypothetical protein [Paracoccus sp. (in: a-proteobacteria)]|uniref:hypothetical protein n=1 Tax=Paracoccus sp. TaxID=267 RepID=UPI00289A7DF0|nr:hypothetical protein [Paracoccus sp. (in: a-proteobacteria)]
MQYGGKQRQSLTKESNSLAETLENTPHADDRQHVPTDQAAPECIWLTPTPTAAARVSGTIKALYERACEVVHHDHDCPAIGGNGDADCKCDAVPFLNDFEALAAIQPDPEPAPVSQAALQPNQNISPICQPEPKPESITPVERLFLIKIAMTGTDADFRRYRYRFAKALRATPSSAGMEAANPELAINRKPGISDSAGMVSVEAAAVAEAATEYLRWIEYDFPSGIRPAEMEARDKLRAALRALAGEGGRRAGPHGGRRPHTSSHTRSGACRMMRHCTSGNALSMRPAQSDGCT